MKIIQVKDIGMTDLVAERITEELLLSIIDRVEERGHEFVQFLPLDSGWSILVK